MGLITVKKEVDFKIHKDLSRIFSHINFKQITTNYNTRNYQMIEKIKGKNKIVQCKTKRYVNLINKTKKFSEHIAYKREREGREGGREGRIW